MKTFPKLATIFLAATMLAQPLAAQVQPDKAEVTVKDGNIVYSPVWHRHIQLTFSGQDDDPVLSPDGKWVIYTHYGSPTRYVEGENACEAGAIDELRIVSLDAQSNMLLYHTSGNVCSFEYKRIDSAGKYLYFLSPAYATSAALYRFDFYKQTVEFVTDANNVIVVPADCKRFPEYKDSLLVLQHRYYIEGGSYDWYWLYKPDQLEKEGGYIEPRPSVPVGEYETGSAALHAFCGE